VTDSQCGASDWRRAPKTCSPQLDREFTERNKIEILLRELLDARRGRKSEQLSVDQLALFAATWQARQLEAEAPDAPSGSDDDDAGVPGGGDAARGKEVATDSLWRGISSVSASCTIWRKKRSTALLASTICGPSAKSAVSATNTSRRN